MSEVPMSNWPDPEAFEELSDAARRELWEELPNDPDPHQDLGYQLVELEIIETPGTDQVVFLPADEDMLHDDSFIVARKGDVRDLG